MADRQVSLKELFVFTTLVAIALACWHRATHPEPATLLGVLGGITFLGLVFSVVGILIGGRIGLYVALGIFMIIVLLGVLVLVILTV